ncbi:MAG TPA: YceI family protein [Kofleriaceae bacterium]|nr:YceI family protein [Kofleriaceae bacterium]
MNTQKNTNTWNIDLSHSGIGFAVRHMVFARVRGRFGAFRGALQLDPGDLTRSRVEVEIDARSIDTGVADRDKHLRSPDFFDVESFPTLRFESTAIEAAGGERYRVRGALTIRDVTREVVLEVEYGGQAKDPWGNQRVAFTAKTSVDRGEFGLTWNQVLETGGILVGDRIEIELEVQAVQAAAAAAA